MTEPLRLPNEWLNVKPCPNLFEFRLIDPYTHLFTPMRKRVMCDKVKGHPGRCRVKNPNDGLFYEVPGVQENLGEEYFKAQ